MFVCISRRYDDSALWLPVYFEGDLMFVRIGLEQLRNHGDRVQYNGHLPIMATHAASVGTVLCGPNESDLES